MRNDIETIQEAIKNLLRYWEAVKNLSDEISLYNKVINSIFKAVNLIGPVTDGDMEAALDMLRKTFPLDDDPHISNEEIRVIAKAIYDCEKCLTPGDIKLLNEVASKTPDTEKDIKDDNKKEMSVAELNFWLGTDKPHPDQIH